MKIFKTKKVRQVNYFVALLLLLLNSSIVFAQVRIQNSVEPLVGKRGVHGVFRKIPKICVAPLQVRMDSAMRTAATNPYQQGIGVPIDVNITMENAGKWKKTKTHRIWSVEIEVEGADQVLIGFDKMNLPENAELYYYSSDKKNLAKSKIPFLNKIFGERGRVALPALNRNGTISSVIIEYREPIQPYDTERQFRINKIIFGRFLNKRTSLRSIEDAEGGSCEIDINCPEGVCWHSEGMAIGNIEISGGEYGTGVLLNTVASDNKIYLYTARHVVSNLDDFNIQFSSVNFLFKSDACNSPSNYEVIFYPITAIRAISTINDFALLELEPNPNPAANDDHKLTYMGWTRDSNPPLTPITCLHHPDDPTVGGTFPLKISPSQSTVITNDVAVEFGSPVGSIGSGHLWRVQFPIGQRVNNGSSGSPLFDANHIVRGHLVGGETDCDVVGNNWYGRFDIAWEGEGTPATALKYWLDPNNTNPQSAPTRNPIQFECISGGVTPQASISAFNVNSVMPIGTDYSFFWTISGDAYLLYENIIAPYAEIEYTDNGNNGTFEVCYDMITPNGCTTFLGNSTCQMYKWHDLYMKDGTEDNGIEPNTAYLIRDYSDYDSDGDYWEIINGDMWDSPDLWNRTNAVTNFSTAPKTHQDLEQNSFGTNVNTAMIEVRNQGATCSPAANVHLYWALASTGELWHEDSNSNDWVQNDYDCAVGTITVGDQIGTILIPENDIAPSSSKKYGIHWNPPSASDFSSCGISPDGHNGLDFMGVFEVCLLSRLESEQDPILGEQNGSIKPNVLNNNNIVTRNSFIVPVSPIPPGGGVVAPSDIVKFIIIKNSDEFGANLNVTFESLVKNLSNTNCGNDFYIDFVLSPELWQKWESTGKKAEGISIIAPYVVRITDCSIAKLKDIPFEPMETMPLGVRAQEVSGKTENVAPPNFFFKISHEASNTTQSIKQPSTCLFRVVNNHTNVPDEQVATSNSLLKVYPNPSTNEFVLDFDIEYTPMIASIRLYDVQGKQVSEIAKEQVYEKGNFKIHFDAGGLPQGVYFVVMESSLYKKVAKIIKI